MLRAVRRFSNVIQIENPYTFEIVSETPVLTKETAGVHLNAVSDFQKFTWRKTPLQDRIKAVEGAMEYFLLNSRDIAIDITSVIGKPLAQSTSEVKGVQEIANSLIEVAPKALNTVVLNDEPSLYRAYEKHPVGVVLQITPWNNPLKSTMPHLLTSILAGNGVVMLNSPYTYIIGKHIEKAFEEVGLPDLVRCFHIDINDTKTILDDKRIGYVSFTGGNEGGSAVNSQVADRLFVDVGLYLNCSNACYVAEDCDLDAHLAGIINGCLDNSGQQSTNIERVFVHKSRYEEFLVLAEEEIKKYIIGDPQLEDTTIGPLCVPEAPLNMQNLIEEAVSEGAQLICGGRATNDETGQGRFFEPTLICDLNDEMKLFREENFGPIVSVDSIEDDAEAIRRINASKYGYITNIYTSSRERGLDLTSKTKSGLVTVNCCNLRDPMLPLGGWRASGKHVAFSEIAFNYVTKTRSIHCRF